MGMKMRVPCCGWHTCYKARETTELTMDISNSKDEENTVREIQSEKTYIKNQGMYLGM